MSIGKPESQETFDDSFFTEGLTAKACMKKVERLLKACRREAADLAKEWLLKHGYFNGEITSHVSHLDKEKLCHVKVILTCFGLPQVRDKQ